MSILNNTKSKILVVDDEIGIRRILATRLSLVGYEVVAVDEPEALDIFSQAVYS